MDTVFLRDYAVVAKHGYYKEEHEKAQRFIVSISVLCDLRRAGTSDSIEETLNYEYLRRVAHDVLMQSPHSLLESLAEEIAQKVLTHPKVESVEVEITKPDIWSDCMPGITIMRTK
jgi:dihydroneopterin aldolase